MFDLGFSELLLIALIALIVLGPQRLPRAARFAGLWVRRARAQWWSVRSEIERELAADELRRSLDDGRRALADAEAQLRDMQGIANIQGVHGAMRSTTRDAGAAESGVPASPASDAASEANGQRDP